MPSDDTHVLLVHGAFHAGWCWDRLLPHLTARGIEASVVDLPFTSQADDRRTVEEAIDRLAQAGRRVVVGHSHGGSVISGAGYRADHLVYLTALMTAPDDEFDLGGTPGMSAIVVDGDTVSIDLSQAVAAFYHRCDPADGEWATARLRPMPVVAMSVDPSGGGYWLVASDGGIFNFGNAPFQGSEGGIKLNNPVVGMSTDAQTGGYWLVASDGGIFNFDAPFYGSTGSQRLNQPVVGMSPQPDGGGYRLVARDGGVFNFGDAAFYGSLPGEGIPNPQVTTMSSSADGNGYYLINAAGTVWAFGDAPYLGNA